MEVRMRRIVEISEEQFGFIPRCSKTDAIFALRQLLEKYHEGQKKLHCFHRLGKGLRQGAKERGMELHENERSAREIHQDSARHVPEKLYPGQDCCGNH